MPQEDDLGDIIEDDVINDVIKNVTVTNVNFSIHKPTGETTFDDPDIQCSSPKRQRIREEVCDANVRNAEYLIKKYSHGKRVMVAEFKEGEHVSLKIPKTTRHSADLTRLPCVIVNKSSGNQSTYRLICRYGTLKQRVTASNLMPYPGDIKCGKPDIYVPLAEAVHQLLEIPAIFCRCKKGGCKTKQCRCKTTKMLCTSRCHKGKNGNCKNTTADAEMQHHVENTLSAIVRKFWWFH